MNKIRGNRQQILSWAVVAGLALAPVALAPSAHAQQADWGQAGPPPDAQNGQIPPPPPPPPESAQEQQNGAAAAAPTAPVTSPQPAQQGQWGQAGPPPDAPNGQIPPPPQDQGTGGNRPEYQPPASGQRYSSQVPLNVPTAPVTIQAGTTLHVRTSQPLDVKKLQPGDYFEGTLAQNIFSGNLLAIPRGAEVVGRVVDIRKPGELKGNAELTLQLTALNLSGRSYPLSTDTWSISGPGKGGYTATNTVGSALIGALVGAIAGGGPGAAIGAVAGTGVGLGASAATSGPRAGVPPEAVLSFRLASPITVQPVSYQEAQQLEENSAPPQRAYPARYGAPLYPGYPPPPPPPAYFAGPYAPYPYVYGYPRPYPYGYYRYRRW